MACLCCLLALPRAGAAFLAFSPCSPAMRATRASALCRYTLSGRELFRIRTEHAAALQPRCQGLNARSVLSVLPGQAKKNASIAKPRARVAATMLAGTRLGASDRRDGSGPRAARGIVLCVGQGQRSRDGSASAPLKKSKTSRYIVGAQTGPTSLGMAQGMPPLRNRAGFARNRQGHARQTQTGRGR